MKRAWGRAALRLVGIWGGLVGLGFLGVWLGLFSSLWLHLWMIPFLLWYAPTRHRRDRWKRAFSPKMGRPSPTFGMRCAVEAQAGGQQAADRIRTADCVGRFAVGNRILWDGVELPALYHFGGLRTVLAKSTVDSPALQPAGYGSAYGRGLGGILLCLLLRFRKEFMARYLPIFSTRVHSFRLPFHPGCGMAVSGRIGYVDRLIPLLSSAPLAGLLSAAALLGCTGACCRSSPLARRWTGTAVLSGARIGGFANTGASQSGCRQRETETWTRTFYRIAADYLRSQSGQKVEVTPWFGIDEDSWRALFGGVISQLSRRDIRYGLRAVISQRPLHQYVFVVGADVLGDVAAISREGTLTRPRGKATSRSFDRVRGAR